MAPIDTSSILQFLESNTTQLLQTSTNSTNSTSLGPAIRDTDSPQWTESLNANSVQLLAMLVSDAGIAADQPQWWNSAPLGCLLIGIQPRGSWQIMQRSVQWGQDNWSSSFGVNCPMNVLYQYFTCSIRNRIEVWDSIHFDSPTEYVVAEGAEPPTPGGRERKASTASMFEKGLHRFTTWGSQRDSASGSKPKMVKKWVKLLVDGDREFNMSRPSKLIDGSRGGNAYMCELLRPKDGATYTIDEQARWQYVSVVLVAMGLLKHPYHEQWKDVLARDFQVDERLGKVFTTLKYTLILFNLITTFLVIAVAFAMFEKNVFRRSLPFLIQIASLFAWAFGSVGLLMIGGNPRVQIIPDEKRIPSYIEERIDQAYELAASPSFWGGQNPTEQRKEYLTLNFGYLNGSEFHISGGGTCKVRRDIVEALCSSKLKMVRPVSWYLCIGWFLLFLGISVALLIASSLVATIYSQILAVGILIVTAVARGWGISGPEDWMIPKLYMRGGASYGANLLGPVKARA
ncbi:uncharacterized protein DFL_005331 [Arthrobotrys flagrans]|uniref:Uncharacterized protein n=1 Tax=Arthrobotrys flagrans TaxID=97331 RepID=A0A437A7B3_ARTFL|nr:hypothetical protein DFL_005331 [Arthrobotrys flagrans]